MGASANATFNAVLRSWSLDPAVIGMLLLIAAIYLRGWLFMRDRMPARFNGVAAAFFFCGLGVVFLAIESPLDTFAYFLLSVHMVQHVLLMFLAPLLIWMGQPLLPLLMGLPLEVRRYWLRPLLRQPVVRGFFRGITHPVPAWTIFVGLTWLWHLPALYEWSLESQSVHDLEHACFFYSGLLFWWPVFQPYPSAPLRNRWIVLPYLVLAGVQGTALSAIFTFSTSVIYPSYARMPRISELTPLEDQAFSGAIMWIPGSLAYLIPLLVVSYELMMESAPHSAPVPQPRRTSREPEALNLLQVPLFGRLLRWRHARLVLQVPLLVIAALVIFDGLAGPQIAPLNLAGVVPWIYWRGLIVLGLLVAGNLFCMACPFMLPRKFAKLLLRPRRPWPQRLRTKWLAVALVVLFFWAYEALSLWDSPWWTALIALAYFVFAFAIDALFRDAPFCKYLCPAGQFQMVQSLTSPMEVRVHDPRRCRTCRTKDCIRGRESIPGCELHLFQPRKAGNLDCTFCLDCIHACPYDNVGILGTIPGRELWLDRQRSGVGRFRKHPDIAALVVVLVFAAFANAMGMIAPVMAVRYRVEGLIGSDWMPFALAGAFLFALVLLPLFCVWLAARLTQSLAESDSPLLEIASRFAYSLLPIGAAMWIAHYSFHLFTSADALIPATWQFLGATHSMSSGMASSMMMSAASGGWLLRWEILCLDAGVLLSLYAAYRIGLQIQGNFGRAMLVAIPWAVIVVALFVLGVWILFQPMQMRGMMAHGG